MSRDLVQRNFRYVNGLVAKNQPVSVVYRSTDSLAPLYAAESGSSLLPNPITTDAYGNVAFYAQNGFYDFLALGARIPFDVEEDSGGGGGGSDTFFEHIQASPAATWTVLHPLPRTPNVTVIVDGRIMLADVEYTDNQVVVTHAAPTTGKVILT